MISAILTNLGFCNINLKMITRYSKRNHCNINMLIKRLEYQRHADISCLTLAQGAQEANDRRTTEIENFKQCIFSM